MDLPPLQQPIISEDSDEYDYETNIPNIPQITNLKFHILQVLDLADDNDPEDIIGKGRTLRVHVQWPGFRGIAVMKIVSPRVSRLYDPHTVLKVPR